MSTYLFNENVGFYVKNSGNFSTLIIHDDIETNITIRKKKVKLYFNKIIGYDYQEVYNKISYSGQATKSWILNVQFDNFTIIIACDYKENNNYQEKEKQVKLLFKNFLLNFFIEDYIEF